jgi:serine/threonine-protein kinase
LTVTAPQLLGRYELLHELGRGGMAELYLARRRGVAGFEKLVAIKRILPHLVREAHFVELFQQEARIASRLSHPNICPVDELDEDRGELFLVMEYLEGASWADLSAVVPVGDESLRLAAGVLAQACEGLHHAHTLRDGPVIHRDVSPQNLFVTINGTCKVLDFGVAKVLHQGAEQTRSGVLKGKLPYMSPEQIEGGELDARSDVWALGVVLWEALAKQMLFDHGTDFQIWKAITETEVPLLAPRGYPAVVDQVLQQALARDRTQRFSTARALGEAIKQMTAPLEPPAIADALRTRCGAKLAERATIVATASVSDLPRSDDQSVVLRAAPVVIDRSRDTAAATVDAMPAKRRIPWVVIGAAGVAVAATAFVIASRHDDPPPIKSSVAAVVPIDATPITVAVVPIDAAVSPPPAIVPRHNNHHAVTHVADAGAPPAVVVETGTGTVTVDSSPYATIYIDDKRIGDTPLFKAPITAGKHTLRAVLSTGTPKSVQITVAADHDLNLGKLNW